jgi:hypothetical protein
LPVTRTLLFLCLCALLCGCAKKSRSTTSEPDSPLGIVLGGAGSGEPKAVLPVRPALPAGWVEFTHPQEAYAVFLPARPRAVNVTLGSDLRQPIPVGRALISDHLAVVSDLDCSLGVMIYSPELVDGLRNVPFPLAATEKRVQVTWAGHPAVEDTFENPESQAISVRRSMWVGNRIYYCKVAGMKAGRPTAAERAAVFDSFVPGK